MDAGDIDAISDRGALEELPAAHYHAAAVRARRLHGEATTPRLKEYLQKLIAQCERLAGEAAKASYVESGHSGLSASTQTDLKPTELRRSEASAPSIRECLPCRLGTLTVCFSIKAGPRPAHDQALGFP